jgi:hypothetical protein
VCLRVCACACAYVCVWYVCVPHVCVRVFACVCMCGGAVSTMAAQVDCRGSDLFYFSATDPSACCANCSGTPACGAWTFTGETAEAEAPSVHGHAPPWADRCYIKSDCRGRAAYAGHTSGTPPPPPASSLARIGAEVVSGSNFSVCASCCRRPSRLSVELADLLMDGCAGVPHSLCGWHGSSMGGVQANDAVLLARFRAGALWMWLDALTLSTRGVGVSAVEHFVTWLRICQSNHDACVDLL